VLAAILSTDPPHLSRVADSSYHGFERIVTRALQKNRDLRYQTADALVLDLQSLRARVGGERRTTEDERERAREDRCLDAAIPRYVVVGCQPSCWR